MSSMFCKKIYQCRNADWCARDYNPKVDDPECFEQLTNYDLLISKTPEELAAFMEDTATWGGCPNHGARDCTSDCGMCWISWLKSPVEVDNG